MKKTILHILVKISELCLDVSSRLDILILGRELRRAEQTAIKSGSKEDAQVFMDAMRRRLAMLPEVCPTKQSILPAWRRMKGILKPESVKPMVKTVQEIESIGITDYTLRPLQDIPGLVKTDDGREWQAVIIFEEVEQ